MSAFRYDIVERVIRVRSGTSGLIVARFEHMVHGKSYLVREYDGDGGHSEYLAYENELEAAETAGGDRNAA